MIEYCDTDKIAIQIWEDWAVNSFRAITVIVDEDPPKEIELQDPSHRVLVLSTLADWWLMEILKTRTTYYGM